MGLTSCRWITIAKTLARRRRGAQSGIMPVAVSLSNAPPTATPSSVMGRESHRTAIPGDASECGGLSLHPQRRHPVLAAAPGAGCGSSWDSSSTGGCCGGSERLLVEDMLARAVAELGGDSR
jgi:hypothetical protein